MTALLHALANLARLRWLGVAFCVLAMLCSTTHASALTRPTASDRVNAVAVTAATASANEREQAKTRVGGFEQNSPLNVCANTLASAETHRGISNAQRETASAFSHGAEGGAAEEAVTVREMNMTQTVENHLTDIVKHGEFRGELARPFMNSPLTIQEIMNGGKPLPDPGGVEGAYRWDVLGTFRGAEGTWQLVYDPATNTILHFNFQ